MIDAGPRSESSVAPSDPPTPASTSAAQPEPLSTSRTDDVSSTEVTDEEESIVGRNGQPSVSGTLLRAIDCVEKKKTIIRKRAENINLLKKERKANEADIIHPLKA